MEPRADFFQNLCAFEEADAEAGALQGERGREPANSSAGNQRMRSFAHLSSIADKAWLDGHSGKVGAFGRHAATMQIGVVEIMRRAIRADRFLFIAHIYEDVGMIEGRQSADAHEFLGADPHLRDARLIVEMRREVIAHGRAP